MHKVWVLVLLVGWAGCASEPTAVTEKPAGADKPVQQKQRQEQKPQEDQEAQGGVLEILVTDVATGEPVSGAHARVRRWQTKSWFESQTDEQGIARIDLTPGKYQDCMVGHGRYRRAQPKQAVMDIQQGATKRLDFSLTPALVLTGTVRDVAGRPVEGAVMTVLPTGRRSPHKTDTRGKFNIVWDPGPRGGQSNVCLLARHKERDLAVAIPITPDDKALDITLTQGVTFTGRLTDPEGEPLPGADVRVAILEMGWFERIDEKDSVTDGEGRYEVNAVALGRRYIVTGSTDGYGREEFLGVNADDTENGILVLPDLQLLPASYSIRGVAVDDQGRPLVNAFISAYAKHQPHCSAHTDEQGRFVLPNVCKGRIRINAHHPKNPSVYGSVFVKGGEQDVRIMVEEQQARHKRMKSRSPR